MLGSAAAGAGGSKGTLGSVAVGDMKCELACAGNGAGVGSVALNVLGTGDGNMAPARRRHGNAAAPANCAADIRRYETIADLSALCRPCAVPAIGAMHTKHLFPDNALHSDSTCWCGGGVLDAPK